MTFSDYHSTSSQGPATAGGGPSGRHKLVKHKRRFCKTPGCTRIVKSQGLCQRHGAVAKKCKVAGCSKQAQGNFARMCKAHFKESQAQAQPVPSDPMAPVAPVQVSSSSAAAVSSSSVYEKVLPNSVGFIQSSGGNEQLMPLAQYLRDGYLGGKPAGWHRTEERIARGLIPLALVGTGTELEAWECELAWTEILVLSGSSDDCFAHLAHAWGNEDWLTTVLSQFLSAAKSMSREQPVGVAKQREQVLPPKQPGRHHQRISTLDVWGLDDPLDGETFDFEFNFENLEGEVKSLGSGDEENTGGYQADEAQYYETCQPCNHHVG